MDSCKKRIFQFLLITLTLCLLLAGCSKKEETQTQTQENETAETQVEEEETEKKEETVEETQTVEETPLEPVETLETDDEARLNIAFLGRTSKDLSLEDILHRAADTLGYDFLSRTQSYHLVYGLQGEENNVLLLLPSEDADMRICAYPKKEEVYYQQEDDLPVVYVECADVYHIHTGILLKGSESWHYTAISTVDNTLIKPDEGLSEKVYDLTDYSIFDSKELPAYSLYYEQSLRSDAPGISEDLKDDDFSIGAVSLSIIDSCLYQVYEINPEKGGKKYYYAVSYDIENKEMKYLVSSNQRDWYVPGEE